MVLSVLILSTFLFAVFCTKQAIRFARHKNIMDEPDSNVKLHKKAVPYMGGAAIAAAAYTFYLIYAALGHHDVTKMETVVLLCGILIFAMGMYDDLHRVSPAVKLAFQSAAALILILFNIRLDIYFFPDYLNIILTFFWLVGISNAFNLVDIMDGLCGGITVIGTLFLFFATNGTSYFLIFLTAAVLGFLVYNFPPAKIYMGDAGSLTIGFLLAAYSIMGSYTVNNKLALISPVIILWLPIYEVILVSVMRIKKGKSPFMGSKDHFAFRLKALGFPTHAVLITTYFLSIIMGESALIAVYMGDQSALVVYALLVLFFTLFFYLLSLADIDSL